MPRSRPAPRLARRDRAPARRSGARSPPAAPTLLENGDDSDNSAADFAEVDPAAAQQRLTPVARRRARAARRRRSTRNRPTPTNEHQRRLHLPLDHRGASFECKLDLAAFAACESSGVSYTGPADGGDPQLPGPRESGRAAPAPRAATPGQVDTTAPTATIDTHPPDPSPGDKRRLHLPRRRGARPSSAAWSRPGRPTSSRPALSGKTYPDLAQRRIHLQGPSRPTRRRTPAPPASFSWDSRQLARRHDAAGDDDRSPSRRTQAPAPPPPSPTNRTSRGRASSAPSTAPASAPVRRGDHLHRPRQRPPHLPGAGDRRQRQRRPDAGRLQLQRRPSAAGVGAAAPVFTPAPLARPAAGARDDAHRASPPRRPTTARRRFRFRSDTAGGATFECAVDRQPFKPCRSPFTTKSLKPGRHSVSGASGRAPAWRDPTPAKFSFKVVKGSTERRGQATCCWRSRPWP